jgi:hypothetical protein
MMNRPPESPRSNVINLGDRIKREIGEPQSPAAGDEPVPIDVGGHGPHPPGMDIGERLARLESAQEWTKIFLGLIGAVLIGGFAFLGVQINRLDAKFDSLDGRIDSLGGRIAAEGAATRQELIGIATAIANSITAARQIQPQILPVPMPTPGPPPAPGSPPAKQ